MKRLLIPAALAAAALSLAACGSAASPAAPAAPASSPAAAAKPSPSASCKLKVTFDYIERDSDPGASVMADEVGNVDYSSCADTLATFRQEAGQADGECTTIAKAGDNPGYDVSAVPAPPLKDVIESAGPGC